MYVIKATREIYVEDEPTLVDASKPEILGEVYGKRFAHYDEAIVWRDLMQKSCHDAEIRFWISGE